MRGFGPVLSLKPSNCEHPRNFLAMQIAGFKESRHEYLLLRLARLE